MHLNCQQEISLAHVDVEFFQRYQELSGCSFFISNNAIVMPDRRFRREVCVQKEVRLGRMSEKGKAIYILQLQLMKPTYLYALYIREKIICT